jgi:hypothetical protein
MVDTTEVRKGRDEAAASPVNLTAGQKEKINKAIVKAILDETGAPPQEWLQWHFGMGA